MPFRALPQVLLVAWLAIGAPQTIAAPLVAIPERSPTAVQDDARAIPPEIRESMAQEKVASLPEQVLLAQSERLRDAVTRNPRDPAPLHALGTVTFHLGGDAEAFAAWRAAAARDPNLAPAEVMRDIHTTFRLLQKGDQTSAAKQLEFTGRRHANQPHFQLIRAEQAMRARNIDEARRAFTRAYELAPQLYVTGLNLARFLEFSGGDAVAIRGLYEATTRLAPDRPEVWLYLGSFQFRQHDADSALRSFRRLRQLDRASPSAERRLAIMSREAGNLAAAEQWYRRALQARPDAEERARINGALGDALLRQGKTAAARKAIEASLAHAEQLPLVFALATLDEADGRHADAERRYRRVLAGTPGNPLAANNLAMLLIRTGREPGEALRLASDARQSMAGNANIEGTYGCALTENHRHREAVAILGPVANASIGDAWARYCLARSLIATKRGDEARALLQTLIETKPAFERRQEALQMLADLR